MTMQITRMALWKIEKRYKQDGEDGLRDHKPGRLFEPLNSKFYSLVLKEWDEYRCGVDYMTPNEAYKKRLKKGAEM